MSIVLQSSGGGSVTIQEPSTASNLTATLPAATGTVMVSGNMPAFLAYTNTNQSVSSGVATKVAFNAEEFDTNSCFDSTTNYRFTPNVAGYYQINAPLTAYSNASNATALGVFLYKNGSQFSYTQTNTGATVLISVNLSIVVYANGTTDYFEIYAGLQGSGLFVSGGTGGNKTSTFSASLIRAA